MTATAPIIEKVRDYINKHNCGGNEGLLLLEYRTGVWRKILEKISRGEIERYKVSTLNTLYDFFHLERDEFYMENMDKLKQGNMNNRSRGHESTFGSIMQAMRKRKKLSTDEVARAIRVDEKTIRLIEYGITLPNVGSYTLTKLLDLYEFSEEDRNTLGWMITISKDTHKILKRISEEQLPR